MTVVIKNLKKKGSDYSHHYNSFFNNNLYPEVYGKSIKKYDKACLLMFNFYCFHLDHEKTFHK